MTKAPRSIPQSVALPTIPPGATSSPDVLVLVYSTDNSKRRWLIGHTIRRVEGPDRWQVATWERCTVLAWQPLPPLPGDEAEALPLATCRAMVDYWQRRAAEAGTAAGATPDEIETSEYWRLRAEEAERQIRAGAVKGLGIDEDREIE